LNIGNSTKRVILTGAGFSKNFGGLLAEEFNSALMSDPSLWNYSALLEDIRSESNFEVVYAKWSEIGGVEFDILHKAVQTVFFHLNGTVTDFKGLDLTRLMLLLERIHHREKENVRVGDSSYLFSLNQDLFLERLSVEPYSKPNFQFPGVPALQLTSQSAFAGYCQELNPAETSVFSLQGRFNVVKIHGSSSWKIMGKELMVIGASKTKTIQESELLNKYLDIFCKVLNISETHLLIIGYGFGDDHINKCIYDAMRAGLKVWVWDVSSRSSWLSTMSDKDATPEKNFISKNIYGFLNHPLAKEFESKPRDSFFHLTLENFLRA
jgi:hypothetical protein